MLNVNIKFGRRALSALTQVRVAGYVIPAGSPQERTLEDMRDASAKVDSLYAKRVLDRQDRDAARVRIEAKVRKLRLKKR